MNTDLLSVTDEVFGETRLLFHRLRAVVEELHRKEKITAAMRGVMEGIAEHGPQTVPAMARRRPVSRQHIQTVVNQLIGRGFCAVIPNPAHRRSPLVGLTNSGMKKIQEMKETESKFLAQARFGVSRQDMETTARTLRAIVTFFEQHTGKR